MIGGVYLSIREPKVIRLSSDVDGKDVEFVAKLLQRSVGDMYVEVCAQCGKCTSNCPVSKVIEGFNPRQLVSKVALGKINELIMEDAIWTCTTCLKCRERCPASGSRHHRQT